MKMAIKRNKYFQFFFSKYPNRKILQKCDDFLMFFHASSDTSTTLQRQMQSWLIKVWLSEKEKKTGRNNYLLQWNN